MYFGALVGEYYFYMIQCTDMGHVRRHGSFRFITVCILSFVYTLFLCLVVRIVLSLTYEVIGF
jgi:hypothetical protein